MKTVLFLIVMIFSVTFAKSDDKTVVNKIRTEFYKAVENEDALNNLFDYIKVRFGENIDKYPALIYAYFGALEAVSAQYTYNPYTKASNVYSGLKKLNKAVDKMPDALEVRFLRFAVLDHLPGVFGLGTDRDNDMKKVYSLLLKKDYSDLPKEIQKGLAEYLVKSERLESYQTNELKKVFPEIK